MSEQSGVASSRGARDVLWPAGAASLTVVGNWVNVLPGSVILNVAGSVLVILSAVRLAGLALAPRTDSSRFSYDLEHARMLSFQFLNLAIAVAFRAAATTVAEAATRSALSTRLLLVGGLACAWVLVNARVRRYSREGGGLVAAYGLTEDLEEALDTVAQGNPSIDRATKIFAQSLAMSILAATLASGAQAHHRIGAQDRERTADRSDTQPTGTPTSPALSDAPPGENFANEKCGYPVHGKIATGVPPEVGAALISALLNPARKEEIEAPGVVEAGCPDRGTHRVGDIFVTPLFHWATDVRLGMLVSDERGNAAVVFPELREQVQKLIDERRLVRVTRRVRTPTGDMQLLFIDGEGCALTIRQYGGTYYLFTGRPLDQLMRIVSDRQEVPRVLSPAGERATYEFEFARTRPKTVKVAHDREVLVVPSTTAVDVGPSHDCASAVEFLEVAHEQEPDPETTP